MQLTNDDYIQLDGAVARKINAETWEITLLYDEEESLSSRDAADLLGDAGLIGPTTIVEWIGGNLYMVEEALDKGGHMDGYNGWSNRATWCVALWMGNDEGLNQERGSIIDHAMNENNRQDAVENVAEALRELWEGFWDEVSLPPHLTDIMDDNMNKVDWDEIATSWLADEDAPDEWEANEA